MTIEQATVHPGTPRPVPVEITNAEALAGMAARTRPRGYVRSVYRTFVFTAGGTVGTSIFPILAEDLSREDAYLIAYGNSVVICETQSQAQDPDNAVAGTGVFANTPANPQGTLLYVPSGATFTTPQPPVSEPLYLRSTEVVWAVALAFPTLLAVVTHNRAEGY